VLFGHLADEKRGYLGAVTKRFAIHIGQLRDPRLSILRANIQFCVMCTQMFGNGFCVSRLIIPALIKTDGKGPNRPFALCLHQGNDGPAVHATTQKCPQRYIRKHLITDAGRKLALRKIDGRIRTTGQRIR